MMVSTCSNELKFMSERERSTKPALNGYTNPDFRELRPVDQSDGVPLSRTRVLINQHKQTNQKVPNTPTRSSHVRHVTPKSTFEWK